MEVIGGALHIDRGAIAMKNLTPTGKRIKAGLMCGRSRIAAVAAIDFAPIRQPRSGIATGVHRSARTRKSKLASRSNLSADEARFVVVAAGRTATSMRR
jgi:hypothetical protein